MRKGLVSDAVSHFVSHFVSELEKRRNAEAAPDSQLRFSKLVSAWPIYSNSQACECPCHVQSSSAAKEPKLKLHEKKDQHRRTDSKLRWAIYGWAPLCSVALVCRQIYNLDDIPSDSSPSACKSGLRFKHSKSQLAIQETQADDRERQCSLMVDYGRKI